MNKPTKLDYKVSDQHSLLTSDDLHWINEGTHYRMFEKMGSHPINRDGVDGAQFAVWAPNARDVFVMGDFNAWSKSEHRLIPRGHSGIWEGFLPDAGKGSHYKYFIRSSANDYEVEKGDPFAFYCEVPPKTASIVWDLDYQWNDQDWMTNRREHNKLGAPMSIYEIHLGSWKKIHQDGGRSLSYREMAEELVDYVKKMGFTHVEFMPVMEHPFFPSWGYQCTAFFAPTSRYGNPQDLMYLIDMFHQNQIGVILDWVPSHFPTDQVGLGYFDGTHLYEHADPRQGIHPDWGSAIFNYGRNEVRAFLISNALFWLEKYHIDGLRVDAVASMLYLNYSREEGQWIPNIYGGNENLEAIEFLRIANNEIYKNHPDVQTIAEESTAWPMVSRPTVLGGLGFGLKWDMGWMHDMLQYMSREPIHRKYHHNNLTFRMLYAFNENFVLPLSHDEVVHGKGALASKMPGDDWQKFANLRCLFGAMYAQPAKKLLFMGGEIGQWSEWDHNSGIRWDILEHPNHAGVQRWVQDLNHLYRDEPSLHQHDCDISGFDWIDFHDADSSTLSFLRLSGEPQNETMLVVFNFTPIPRENYRIGVPHGGYWQEMLNSDSWIYWGSGIGNAGGITAEPFEIHSRPFSLNMTLPPLSVLFFKHLG